MGSNRDSYLLFSSLLEQNGYCALNLCQCCSFLVDFVLIQTKLYLKRCCSSVVCKFKVIDLNVIVVALNLI